MYKTLKILLVEDSPDDVGLIEHELMKAGLSFECRVARNKAEYVKAIDEYHHDVILSDHSLPDFNSIEALDIYRKHRESRGLIIPFILVTGNVSEEFAIHAIKAGVDDYVLKHHLKRLPMAIKGGLEKCQIERERRKYLEQVLAKEALMNEAEQLAGFGSWEADLRTGKHIWSDSTYGIYGLPVGEVEPDYETFINMVDPGDRCALEKKLAEILEHKDGAQYEFRIINPDGKRKYVSCKMKVQRDEEGRPVRLVGFNLDITQKKMAQMALEREEQKYRSLFEQNPDAVFSIDLDWRFINVNAAFEQLLRFTKEELIGCDFRDVLPRSALRNIYADFLSGLHRGRQNYETQFTNRFGNTFTLDVTVMGIVVDGELTGVHCIGKDISDSKPGKGNSKFNIEDSRLLDLQGLCFPGG